MAVALLAACSKTADFTVDPLQPFAVSPGGTRSQALVVRVNGEPVLDFAATPMGSPFAVVRHPLQPEVRVSFTPRWAGTYEDVLTITRGGATVTIPLHGVAASCTSALDCTDEDECTLDRCDAGKCTHPGRTTCPASVTLCGVPVCAPASGCGVAPVPDGRDCSIEVPGGVCMSGVCDAPPLRPCFAPGLPDLPAMWTQPMLGLSSAIASDDRLFASAGVSLAAAFDADGNEVWAHQKQQLLALVDGVLLTRDASGLAGVDVDGNLLWREPPPFDADDPTFSFLARMSSDEVLVAADAMDLSGLKLWNIHVHGGARDAVGAVDAEPGDALGDGRGVVAIWNGGYSLRTTDGTLLPLPEGFTAHAFLGDLLIGRDAAGHLTALHEDATPAWQLTGTFLPEVVGDATSAWVVEKTQFQALETLEPATGRTAAVCAIHLPEARNTRPLMLLTSRGTVVVAVPPSSTTAGGLVEVGPNGPVALHRLSSSESQPALVAIVGGRAIVRGDGTLTAYQLPNGESAAEHGWITPFGDQEGSFAPR